jgi:hypothetical protein
MTLSTSASSRPRPAAHAYIAGSGVVAERFAGSGGTVT